MKPTEITEASSRTDENSVISGQVLFSGGEKSESEGGNCVVSLRRCIHERKRCCAPERNGCSRDLSRLCVGEKRLLAPNRNRDDSFPSCEISSAHKHQRTGNLLIDFFGNRVHQLCWAKFIKTNTQSEDKVELFSIPGAIAAMFIKLY